MIKSTQITTLNVINKLRNWTIWTSKITVANTFAKWTDSVSIAGKITWTEVWLIKCEILSKKILFSSIPFCRCTHFFISELEHTPTSIFREDSRVSVMIGQSNWVVEKHLIILYVNVFHSFISLNSYLKFCCGWSCS